MLNVVQLIGNNFSKMCGGSWVQQGVDKVTGGLQGGITRGRFWNRPLVRGKMDGLGCAFCAGLCNVDPVASVVFRSACNVPGVYTMSCPGVVIGWGFKYEHSGFWGGKGRSIKVEDAVEMCFYQQLRVNLRREEEVQCQHSPRQ